MSNNAYRIAAALTTLLLLAAVTTSAQDARVVSPSTLPGGLSYEQWSAKWWQWAFGIDASHNPIADTTGIDCYIHQSGPVWFLAGTAGGSATRFCTIPSSKMIYFPILNLLNDYPCPDPTFRPGPQQSLEQFLTIGYPPNYGARQYLDHTTQLGATLDGVPLNVDLSLPPAASPFRATSSLFEFTADRSLVGGGDPCITGREQPGVSDGYWIMLSPLSAGQHTLRFRGTQTYAENPPPNTFGLDVTYHLTIVRDH